MPCARGWSPLLPLLLLLLLLSGAAGTYDLVRICNPEGPLSTAFVGEVHARYPWTSHPEWGGACVRLAMFQKIVEDAIANCDIIGSCDATGEQKRDAERAIPPCDTLKALEADAAARLNAWIPFAHAPFLPVDPTATDLAKGGRYADYTLTVDASVPGVEFASPNGKLMLWPTLALRATDLASSTNLSASCTSGPGASDAGHCGSAWLLRPDPILGGTLLGVDQRTLRLSGLTSLAPDLVFGSGLQQQRPDGGGGGTLLRSSSVGQGGGGGWVFGMAGCALPALRLRVSWSYRQQAAAGQTYMHIPGIIHGPADRRTVGCWGRTTTLLGVSAVPMRCTLRNVDTNTLRSMLADAQGTMTTEALRREHTLAHIMRQAWAERADTTQQQTVVTFTRAYAERLLACAQPAGGAVTTSLLGGTWTVPSASSSSSLAGGYPGVCVACSAGINAAALLRSNRQIRACNRSVAAERRVDCCVGCRAGFMPHPWSAEAEACVPWCAPGSALTPTTLGRCAPCAAGTFSIGGAGQCVGCTGLGFTANAYVDEKRGGCVECGVRAELVPGTATAGATCRACPVGQLVTMGRARCAACVVAGQYAPSGSGTTACARCPAGTYQERVGTGVCALCPANAFNGGTGATTCTTCAEGMRHAPNRTVCLRCPAWNATRFPYVEYYEAGCGVRCRPGVAYQRANLYAEGGCGECALVGVPIGAFQDLLVCTTARGCTNAPPNARYTGASAAVGESACPWTCDPGFVRASSSSACVPCAVGGFNATRHRYLGGGCAFTCLPRVYVDLDTGLTCATPCLDALVAYREGRLLFAHVHDYYPAVVGGRAERPRLMQGVCGADSEVLPQSEHPFLRWGRWVHALAPSTPPYTCGNALLDVGEGCDDGNKAAGDGCSPVCAVETSYYWDCDRIGLPCLPHCGWPISSSSSGASNSNSNSNSNNRRGGGGGLNLRGYVLPPCSAGGTMGGCDCEAANLTYRAVVALPAAERAAWMVARLVPCDCGGNAARTVPYEACTATNRGCRECAAGEYHDDTLSRCMRCGSDCARGFTTTTTMLMMVSGAAAACGPTVTTSALLLRRWPSLSSSLLLPNSSSSSSTAAPAVSSFFTEADAQAAMGCTACPQPEGLPKANGLQSVRYLQGCAYACHRDTTGADPSLDVFCNRAVDAATGACPPPGRCVSCELTRQTLVTGGTSPGHYPRGCLDGVGYSWQRCDDDGKPALAEWNTFTIVTGARRGCGWRCVPGSGYAWDGGCLPCFAHSAAVVAATCVSGQEVAFCNPEGTQAVCRPCRGPTPGALQAWRSDAPWFAACIADCEEGVAFRAPLLGIDLMLETNGSTAECVRCSRVECVAGERRVACGRRSDATCEPCETPLQADEEYQTVGLCLTRCVAGAYALAASGRCVPCVPVGGRCPAGHRMSSRCALPEERLAPPLCVPCTSSSSSSSSSAAASSSSALQAKEEWWVSATAGGGECERRCVAGHVRAPGGGTTTNNNNGSSSCVVCDPHALCDVGWWGTCALSDGDGGVRLECAPCGTPPPQGTERYLGGDCATVRCLPGLLPAAAVGCAAPPGPSSSSALPNNNNNNGAAAQQAAAERRGGYARPDLVYPQRALRHS